MNKFKIIENDEELSYKFMLLLRKRMAYFNVISPDGQSGSIYTDLTKVSRKGYNKVTIDLWRISWNLSLKGISYLNSLGFRASERLLIKEVECGDEICCLEKMFIELSNMDLDCFDEVTFKKRDG